ncbi:MAG: tetratricopeptide repeat protein [Kiritimatiellae bacterium]|nr:tetratricopeptide repeat protein [Kiritimatiellia bacterium]
MSNIKSICIDLLIGLGLATIAACTYFNTLCPAVYPGPSAGAFVVSSGATPRFSPNSPLWFALCDVVNASLPNVSQLTSLNGLSAICGALAIWALYSVVRLSIWLTIKVEEENYVQSLLASRLAGIVAAFVLTFSLPFWMAANRCHWSTFHLLLLLLALRLFLSSIQYGSNRLSYLFAFIYGIGCVEYSSFYVFTPIITVVFFTCAHKDERLTTGVLFKTLGCFVGGLLAYALAAWSFLGEEGAQLRGVTGFGQSLKILLLNSWFLLSRSLPRQGWLVILVVTSLPWLVTIAMSKRALNGQGDRSVAALHVLLTGLVIAVLLNTPISPSQIGTGARIFLIPELLTAWTMGYFVAYFFLLPLPQWGDEDAVASLGRRVSSIVLPLLLVGFCLFMPWRNVAKANAKPALVLATIAETLLEQIDGQTWLISDGSLDAQLLPLIKRDNMPLKVLSIAAQSYKPLRTHVFNQIKDATLRNRAEIGLEALLGEWFARPNEAVKDVAVMNSADVWSKAGLIPVPNVLFFSGAVELESVDFLALKQRHMRVWDELLPVLEAEIEHGTFAPLIEHTRRRLGLVANNLGVLLEDADMQADAYEVYRRARVLDPNNVSALLNAHGLVLSGGDYEDGDIVKQEMDDFLARFQNRPVRIVDIIANYGVVRESKALASMGEVLSRSGKSSQGISQLERALALSTGDEQLSLEMRLAELYFIQDRHGDSEELLEKLLRENPKHQRALLGMLTLSMKRGEFDRAKKFLEHARRAGVDSSVLRVQEALLVAVEGDASQATDIIDEVLRDNKNVPKAWEMLVNIQIAGRDEKGLQKTLYRIERQSFAKGFLFAYASGHLAMMRGNVDDMARHFEDALVYQPNHIQILQFMIRLDMILSKPDVAEVRTQRLLQLNPNDRVANFFMSNFQIERGEYDLAKESLRRLLNAKRDPLAMNSLAWVLQETGSLDEASKTITEAIAMTDTSPSLWDTYGTILQKQDKLDEAVAAFEKAIALEKNYPASVINLANIHLSEGRTQRALNLVEVLSENMYDLRPEHRTALRELRKKLGFE